ncbi:hypothetical protein LSAT2_014339 [Lamellibrachia satsuma]|nr:hypothetical protein LSAT2_014339 [Lamellibrachia satsuma]
MQHQKCLHINPPDGSTAGKLCKRQAARHLVRGSCSNWVDIIKSGCEKFWAEVPADNFSFECGGCATMEELEPGRRLGGGKVTGRKETGRKETGWEETGAKEIAGVKETGRKEKGQNATEGIRHKRYCEVVIEEVRRRAWVFVGETRVRKTDRALSKWTTW